MDDFFFQPDDLSSLFGPDSSTPDLSGILGDPTNNDLGINLDPFTGGTWGTPDLSNIDPSTIGLLGDLGGTGGDLFTGANWLSALGSLPNLGALLGGSPASSGGTPTTKPATSGNPAGSLLGSIGGLGGLLPALLALGGGLMGRNATNQATQQTVNGINAASDQAKQLIGAAQANYAPFTANVGQSLAKLAAPVNLAGNFKPLGSGKYGG